MKKIARIRFGMRRIYSALVLLLFPTVFSVASALGQAPAGIGQWYLPRNLSDKNFEVRFEVDSTWHLIEGKTSEVDGDASLREASNPTSIEVRARVPVAKFNTGRESRNERLRDAMNEVKYKFVSFLASGIERCTPALVLRDDHCEDLLQGKLTIRDVSKSVEVPIIISSGDSEFIVTGEFPIRWDEYGVEDPSTLLNKVDSTVVIAFELHLRSMDSST